jgi:formylglycine-generating enzyme required for sulfatase activity
MSCSGSQLRDLQSCNVSKNKLDNTTIAEQNHSLRSERMSLRPASVGACTGKYRVLRGGSLSNLPVNVRSVSRASGEPGVPAGSFGFHLVTIGFRPG